MPKSSPITAEKKEQAPAVSSKGPTGRMNRRLRMLADMYMERHPGMDVRWVYSPEHKPELSNVISRQADGYKNIYNKDLGEDFVASIPGLKPDHPVRIGDTVLMAIPAEVRKAIQQELDTRAKGELERVEQEFHSRISSMELPSGMREEYRARPRGRSVIEEVERDIDVDPSLKEEGQ